MKFRLGTPDGQDICANRSTKGAASTKSWYALGYGGYNQFAFAVIKFSIHKFR